MPSSKPSWSKADKAPIQSLLIYRAYIEIEGHKKTDKDSAGGKLLDAFERHAKLLDLADMAGAANMSLEQCHRSLLLSTGTLDKKPVFFNKTSIWRRAKNIVKSLRNDIRPAYSRAKARNEIGNSGTALEDKLQAVKLEMWRSRPIKALGDDDGDEPEADQASCTPLRQSPRKRSAEDAAKDASDGTEASPTVATPSEATAPASAEPKRMPDGWSGPYEFHTWVKHGPFGEQDDTFMEEMSKGPVDSEEPTHLRGSRGRKKQRADEAAAAQAEATTKAGATAAAATSGTVDGKPLTEMLSLRAYHASELEARSDYRSQRMGELEKIIKFTELAQGDTTKAIQNLLDFLKQPDPKLEAAFGAGSPPEN